MIHIVYGANFKKLTILYLHSKCESEPFCVYRDKCENSNVVFTKTNVNFFTETKVKVAMEKRCFTYTRQQWTGKSPKQFLIDWIRKHLPKSPPPSFKKDNTEAISSRPGILFVSIYTIILLKSACLSVGVRKRQVAILARSSREMSQTVRIV